MSLRSSHRRSGEWRLPRASYWPGPARPHIQGFPASDRDVGGGFFDFVARMECPFFRVSTGYLMRDGGEDATAMETCSSSASSRCPQACNFFEGFILGSKLLVIPMTKRDMDIFLIRHRMSVPRPPTLLLVRSSQIEDWCLKQSIRLFLLSASMVATWHSRRLCLVGKLTSSL
ncbi:uncharacterized protein LOC120644280 [Panicum virgatum]|uniref:uncharacterized protein LOC120644280 n=1 Tax=Panicum virgatum TaxID=38727 RepID=UPI0019D5D5C5|nr:uncharacterized protein LOC120644280 [Panicum virgatum]